MNKTPNKNRNLLISGLNQNLDDTFALSTNKNGETRLRVRKARQTPDYSANQYLSQVQFKDASRYAMANQTTEFFVRQAKLRKKKAYLLALSHFRQRPVVVNLSIIHNRKETANLVRFSILHPVTIPGLVVSISDAESGERVKSGPPVMVNEEELKYEFEFEYPAEKWVEFSLFSECDEWNYYSSQGPLQVPAGKEELKASLPVRKKKKKR